MTLFKKVSKLEAAEKVFCPLCQQFIFDIGYEYEREGRRSYFYRCHDCSFIFARPVFIPELDRRQMDGVENAELFNSPLLKKIYIHSFIKKEIRHLRRAQGDGPLRLLDIGCGTGWTTRVYADQGFVVTGLEPSEVRADYARRTYGVEVVCNYMENAAFGREFDVVVLRHIIEHFENPGAALQKVRGFLKPGGVVLVVVPNIDCLGRRLFETRWAWVLPWHCNFFNPRSTRRLMALQGFEVLGEYQTPSPLYYPGALMRTFPNRFVKWLMGSNRVVSMALCAPLAVGGQWFGMGDNINMIAMPKE